MERNYGKLWAAVGILVVLFGSSRAAAEPVRVPGTSVSLEPPKGFLPAERFPGFEHGNLQASIMVTEMPGPFPETKKALTKEGFASRGMILIESRTEKVDGKEGLLVQVAQKAAGTEFLKWMLIVGDQKSTVMIVGTFPKAAEDELGGAIKRSVLSASWGGGSPSDPFEGLQFRVTPGPKLTIWRRMSNMLALTEGGRLDPGPPTEPLYIVGSSISPTRIGDLRSFSEGRAKNVAHTKDVQNFSGRNLRVAGLEAYELLADAKDAATGTPLRLYQVIALEGEGYFIFLGLVGAERAAEFVAEFRRVTATFRQTATQ